jgi:Tol biopolymer transport system component
VERGEYWPQWSRSGEYLAFLQDDDQGTDLVVADPATGAQQVVTSSGAIRNGFSWEPDDTLVYVDGDNAHGDLYTVRPDGTDVRRLTEDDTAKFTPVVSPDGRYVAYARGSGTHLDLYLFDSTTGAAVRLTHGTGRHIGPTGSPDSRFLAYFAAPAEQAKLTSEEAPTSIVRIDVRDPKRSAHVLVTGKTEVIPISWQPSPDGYPSTDGLPFPRA